MQKKGYVDLQEVNREEKARYFYGATLQKDHTSTVPCSWAAADPSTFLIREKNYLKDHEKVISMLELFLEINQCYETMTENYRITSPFLLICE